MTSHLSWSGLWCQFLDARVLLNQGHSFSVDLPLAGIDYSPDGSHAYLWNYQRNQNQLLFLCHYLCSLFHCSLHLDPCDSLFLLCVDIGIRPGSNVVLDDDCLFPLQPGNRHPGLILPATSYFWRTYSSLHHWCYQSHLDLDLDSCPDNCLCSGNIDHLHLGLLHLRSALNIGLLFLCIGNEFHLCLDSCSCLCSWLDLYLCSQSRSLILLLVILLITDPGLLGHLERLPVASKPLATAGLALELPRQLLILMKQSFRGLQDSGHRLDPPQSLLELLPALTHLAQ